MARSQRGRHPGHDPVEEAVNTLSAQTGALFVVSGARGASTIGSPGSADAALTVGAVDRQDVVAPFSSRGPRIDERAIKPDLTAPGVGIVAARSKDSRLEPVGDHFARMSGTSMAAPHVAGAAALLAQQQDWTGQQLKAALTASARPSPAHRV